MTNTAIILVEPGNEANQWLLEEVNSKPFLHYQFSHLEDDFFKQVVLISSNEKESIRNTFGDEYLGIKITYLDWQDDQGQTGNIMNAFEHIDQMQAFVLNAHQHFRLNFSKADDFRRMRDSKVLLIGKKAENKGSKRDKLFLNEKGKIEEITTYDQSEEEHSYQTDTWLISKPYYQNNFQNIKGSLFNDYLKNEIKNSPQFCLACRQYFLSIDSINDLKIAREDFAEFFYR